MVTRWKYSKKHSLDIVNEHFKNIFTQLEVYNFSLQQLLNIQIQNIILYEVYLIRGKDFY